jgi:hypothetical protein
MTARARRILVVLLALLASFAGVGDLAAQRVDPLARAMKAYGDLEYDVAAQSFRAALALEGAARLADADRVRALMHLGATEVFRGRRDEAVQAFRTLIVLDPRYRPDVVVFPPEVSTLYQESRIGVRATSVLVPPFANIRTVADRLPIRIFSASLHDVRVTITDGLGAPVRVMYDGAIGDSVELLWNGRDGLGRLREEGSYRLRVTSRNFEGRDEREVDIPLKLVRVATDTLPWPPELDAASFRPETLITTEGRRYLTTGLVAAALVAVLPSVVGSDNEGSTLRFGVAALLGAGGILGLKRASRPIPIAENMVWNRERRAAQAREVERIRAENEARRAANGLRITSGTPTVVVLP